MIEPELARRVKLLGLDVDGVLTDNAIWIAPIGAERVELKRFDISDGLGLVILGYSEIEIAWVSGRHSEATTLRARELRIGTVIQDSGARKLSAVEALLQQKGLSWSQLAFVGDDLADLPLLKRAGLPITVANGCPEAKALAAWETKATGGYGAVREVVHEAGWESHAGRWWDVVVESILVATHHPRWNPIGTRKRGEWWESSRADVLGPDGRGQLGERFRDPEQTRIFDRPDPEAVTPGTGCAGEWPPPPPPSVHDPEIRDIARHALDRAEPAIEELVDHRLAQRGRGSVAGRLPHLVVERSSAPRDHRHSLDSQAEVACLDALCRPGWCIDVDPRHIVEVEVGRGHRVGAAAERARSVLVAELLADVCLGVLELTLDASH